jgi:S-adenosylmethionine synthetase
MLVQVAYAIGVADPVSVAVDTYGTGIVPDEEIAAAIPGLFDLRPAAIVARFGLKNPIYTPTASYGHFGRKPYSQAVEVWYGQDGKPLERPERKMVEFFGWEKLDAVDRVKAAFGIK